MSSSPTSPSHKRKKRVSFGTLETRTYAKDSTQTFHVKIESIPEVHETSMLSTLPRSPHPSNSKAYASSSRRPDEADNYADYDNAHQRQSRFSFDGYMQNEHNLPSAYGLLPSHISNLNDTFNNSDNDSEMDLTGFSNILEVAGSSPAQHGNSGRRQSTNVYSSNSGDRGNAGATGPSVPSLEDMLSDDDSEMDITMNMQPPMMQHSSQPMPNSVACPTLNDLIDADISITSRNSSLEPFAKVHSGHGHMNSPPRTNHDPSGHDASQNNGSFSEMSPPSSASRAHNVRSRDSMCSDMEMDDDDEYGQQPIITTNPVGSQMLNEALAPVEEMVEDHVDEEKVSTVAETQGPPDVGQMARRRSSVNTSFNLSHLDTSVDLPGSPDATHTFGILNEDEVTLKPEDAYEKLKATPRQSRLRRKTPRISSVLRANVEGEDMDNSFATAGFGAAVVAAVECEDNMTVNLGEMDRVEKVLQEAAVQVFHGSQKNMTRELAISPSMLGVRRPSPMLPPDDPYRRDGSSSQSSEMDDKMNGESDDDSSLERAEVKNWKSVLSDWGVWGEMNLTDSKRRPSSFASALTAGDVDNNDERDRVAILSDEVTYGVEHREYEKMSKKLSDQCEEHQAEIDALERKLSEKNDDLLAILDRSQCKQIVAKRVKYHHDVAGLAYEKIRLEETRNVEAIMIENAKRMEKDSERLQAQNNAMLLQVQEAEQRLHNLTFSMEDPESKQKRQLIFEQAETIARLRERQHKKTEDASERQRDLEEYRKKLNALNEKNEELEAEWQTLQGLQNRVDEATAQIQMLKRIFGVDLHRMTARDIGIIVFRNWYLHVDYDPQTLIVHNHKFHLKSHDLNDLVVTPRGNSFWESTVMGMYEWIENIGGEIPIFEQLQTVNDLKKVVSDLSHVLLGVKSLKGDLLQVRENGGVLIKWMNECAKYKGHFVLRLRLKRTYEYTSVLNKFRSWLAEPCDENADPKYTKVRNHLGKQFSNVMARVNNDISKIYDGDRLELIYEMEYKFEFGYPHFPMTLVSFRGLPVPMPKSKENLSRYPNKTECSGILWSYVYWFLPQEMRDKYEVESKNVALGDQLFLRIVNHIQNAFDPFM